MGLSPRAGLALMQAARSWAFISGRDFTLPEDIQAILISVVGHRLRSCAATCQRFRRDDLKALFQEVPIP
jgi:MoxR-like ATPase